MKTIVIFYDNKSSYANEKYFGGKSALELTALWAQKLNLPAFTLNSKTLGELLYDMKKICENQNAQTVIFAYNDLPYLDIELSKKIIDSHHSYKSEYTFADGYPYGFAPEALNAGTIGILAEFASTTQKSLGEKPVSRDCIYNLIKTDINSFDVETIISDADYRLYRFAFHCGKKDNFFQCKALWNSIEINCDGKSASDLSAEEKSALSVVTGRCLKTVPGFYNIQISNPVSYDAVYKPYCAAYKEKYNLSPLRQNFCGMSLENFSAIIDSAADFSEKAVVSLSAWGEPLLHPDFTAFVEKVLSYSGLSVFIETEGLLVTPELCEKLKSICDKAAERTNDWPKIMIAVSIDSFTAETYKKLHKECANDAFEKAVQAVNLLQNALPGCVYPQFVRMNENEAELEPFYRYWSEKSNPSGGNLIIQKYNDFSGSLPPCKPADLSPLERDPCWHLRRDMTILANGDVPACHNRVLCCIAGNVFRQPLEEIWYKTDGLLVDHMQCKYNENCEKCDEWYTFNF